MQVFFNESICTTSSVHNAPGKQNIRKYGTLEKGVFYKAINFATGPVDKDIKLPWKKY